jgi:hypothetical protein
MPARTRPQTPSQDNKKWLEHRAQIILENNYAETDVFQCLREAKASLTPRGFASLHFLISENLPKGEQNSCIMLVFLNDEDHKNAFNWFRKLMKLLTEDLTYRFEQDEDSDTMYEVDVNWTKMHNIVKLHLDDIFVPRWKSVPISQLEF